MRNFKELRIWQKGIDIAVKTYRFTDTFPKEDRYGICQQMTRVGVSIPSNIAEGSSRKSEKEVVSQFEFLFCFLSIWSFIHFTIHKNKKIPPIIKTESNI